jgi:hypothetical protein
MFSWQFFEYSLAVKMKLPKAFGCLTSDISRAEHFQPVQSCSVSSSDGTDDLYFNSMLLTLPLYEVGPPL